MFRLRQRLALILLALALSTAVGFWGYYDFAASRVYYATFYAATAILLSEGLEVKQAQCCDRFNLLPFC
ncbi:MAG: hypothetical protein GX493_11495 [Firmicutes bacterium]|nr:hypothetical protein [Bacillota bacterium]